jgi:hypothetical protein
VNVVHRYHSRCSIPSEFQGSELEKKQNRHTYGPELIMSCVLPNLLCDNCSTTNALVPPRFVVPSVRVFFPPNDGWWLGLPAAGFQSGANRATPPDSCALALWPPRIFFLLPVVSVAVLLLLASWLSFGFVVDVYPTRPVHLKKNGFGLGLSLTQMGVLSSQWEWGRVC